LLAEVDGKECAKFENPGYQAANLLILMNLDANIAIPIRHKKSTAETVLSQIVNWMFEMVYFINGQVPLRR